MRSRKPKAKLMGARTKRQPSRSLAKNKKEQEQTRAMNEALTISAIRQHELTEAAENLNEQLQKEIAERKKAQAAKFLLASIVEGSDDSIISIDFDQVITSWNQGAERLYGYSAKEVIGKSLSVLTLPEDLKLAVSRIDRIKAGEKVDSFEIQRIQKDGRHMWVSVTLSAIKDGSGRAIGVSTVSREITKQKHLEEQLRVAKHELEHRADRLEEIVAERTSELRESMKHLQDLTYTIAHDLRAPIRAMLSFSNALIEDVPLDQTGKDYADRISKAAERMDRLVNDLIDYAQLAYGEFPIHPINLKSAIQKVLVDLEHDIQSTRAEIQVQEPMPLIAGNETLVEQILCNLLLNALKFVAPGIAAKILLRAELRDLVVRLWIEDQGIGVAPGHQEQIFGVFQRLHTSEEYPGTGIGLAIVKRAAERMGGNAGVDSQPGKGSRFWVEFAKG